MYIKNFDNSKIYSTPQSCKFNKQNTEWYDFWFWIQIELYSMQTYVQYANNEI